MSDALFQAGQIVKLKTGGPLMTIASQNRCDDKGVKHYVCWWFTHDGIERVAEFPEPVLKLDP